MVQMVLFHVVREMLPLSAIVDEYHPSLGTRVPPTVIEAGAEVGHHTIINASALIES